MNDSQYSGELLGSEGAAAENKALKKQMQREENPSCLAAVSLCWDDKGSGKKDWIPTGVHLSPHTKTENVDVESWEWKVCVVLFFLLPHRAMKTNIRNMFAIIRSI